MIAHVKKSIHRGFLDWEKDFNKQVNKIRYVIEQAIANFKTWRIMHTDVALHFCVGSWVWLYG
ncbi:MAG: hypothetical protein M3460_20925 [Actinomycetota bacterium]|nr:hypothetical protein [Actinomycetota bacterium]